MYQSERVMENKPVLFIDLISIIASFAMAFGVRYQVLFGRETLGDQIWIVALAVIIYISVSFYTNVGFNFYRRGFFEEFVNVIKTETSYMILLLLMLFFMHRSSDLSRLVFGYTVIFNTIFMYGIRTAFKLYMLKIYRSSKNSKRMLVVTNSGIADAVLQNLSNYSDVDRQIVGIVVTDTVDVKSINGTKIVANCDNLIDYTVRNEIDEVFVIDDTLSKSSLIEKWTNELSEMGVIVNINIDVLNLTNNRKKQLNQIGPYAVASFARNLFTPRQLFVKRLLDIVGSLIGMVFLGLAFIIVAPAIKLDSPGPVFFKQIRIGKNGRKFVFYKFRSMYQDAEERKKALLQKNEIKGLMFKMENDPRITNVGRFLRRASIDELPQFWNVLKGDMSLVGTRPPTVDEFEQYEAKHKCRLSMTPGITGMWQISGRSDIKDFDEVVKLDMQYIDNWTILKDIKILLVTIKVVLLGKGSV